MSYQVEVHAIRKELYESLEKAAESLNTVQSEFEFKISKTGLREYFYLYKSQKYKVDDVFRLIGSYRESAKGDRRYSILVVDGPLESSKLGNLFGSTNSNDGMAVFTVNDFDQFVHDLVRYNRYYLVRYALSFVAPEIKSHNDPTRKDCIFHKKINKSEIKFSLDSGHICDECQSKLSRRISQPIHEAIVALLSVVSNQHPYSLVIKGGGVKGLAFVGALIELEKHFSFNSFAGTSAGAIAAVLLGAGYKPQELATILNDKDFREFKDANLFQATLNLLFRGGLYPGDSIEAWLKQLLEKKFPNKLRDVELADFESHTVIYSTRSEDGTLVFDSKDERKHSHAAFATRCSMSIPFYFVPRTVDGRKVYDGGLRNNFPLEVFMSKYPSQLVIGLYLIAGAKRKGDTIAEIADIAISGEERSIVERNLDKVVVIDARLVGTTDFALNERKKSYLLQSGRLGALKFLARTRTEIGIRKSEIASLQKIVEDLGRNL